MKTIEILFSTAQSEGEFGSRIIECDEWRWRVRHHTVDVHLDGTLVAQFDAAAVLGVVDLEAVPDTEDDDRAEDGHRDAGGTRRFDPRLAGRTSALTPTAGSAAPDRDDDDRDDYQDDDDGDDYQDDDDGDDDHRDDGDSATSRAGDDDHQEDEHQEHDHQDDDKGDDRGDRTDDPDGEVDPRAFTPGVGGDPWPTKGRRRGPRPAPLQRPRR